MSAFARILTWPLRHPLAIIAIALLCAALAAIGASRIHVDPSLKAMFARDNTAALALTRVMDDFGAVDELLVVASLPGEGPVTSAEIEKLTRFGDRLVAELPADAQTAKLVDIAMDRPDAQSRQFFEQVLVPAAVYYLDDDAFAAARDRLTQPKMREQVRQDEAMMSAPGAAGSLGKALMRDPLRLRDFTGPFFQKLASQKIMNGREGTDAFISPDGRNMLVRVRGKQSPSNLDFCVAFKAGVATVAERVNADHLELRYAGSYAVVAASASAIRHDMISSVTGSVLLLQLLFLLAYRGAFKLFALAFGPIAIGLLLGFGGYAIYSTALTPMTAVLGGILAGMAIDYSIQYLSLYISGRDAGAAPRKRPRPRRWGSRRPRSRLGPPASWAFWRSALRASKRSRDFAILGTLGLTGAFLVKTALLPMLLMLTDSHKSDKPPRSAFRFRLEPLLVWIGQRRRWGIGISISLFVAVLLVLLILPGEMLPLESDLTVMHPRPNAAIDAQNLIAARFGMHDWLMVHLSAASTPELVALAHRVQDRFDHHLDASAGVAGSFGLAGLLPNPDVVKQREAMLGPAQGQRVAADFQAVIDQSAFNPDAPEIREYGLFLNLLMTRPAPTMDTLLPYRRLAELILPRSAFSGKPVTEAITLVFINGSTDDRATRDAAVEGINKALSGISGATVTGLSVMSHDTELTVRRDLPRLSILVLVIVLAYLMVHFRNVADAVLAIVPTAFSLVVLLAAMRLAGQKVNMVNLIAAPLLIGIDVDYGIFLVSLSRVKQARQMTTRQLIARIAPVCHAVAICAVATIIGYGSLIWTSVPAIRSLGFAVAVGIAACLFCVLFFLTPVFISLTRKNRD